VLVSLALLAAGLLSGYLPARRGHPRRPLGRAALQ